MTQRVLSPASSSSSLSPDPFKSPSSIQIHNQGRPPWFDFNLNASSSLSATLSETFVIGVAGGSASGKTSVSELIIKNLDVPWVVLLSMDSFYKNLTAEQIERAHRNDHNFDHPDAFDYDLLLETLQKLKSGKNVEVPIYDFKTHSRLKHTRKVYGANIIIFEGIMAFYDQRILSLMDLKVFVDTDDDVRLARRLKRDIAERGRDLHGVIQQYNRFVKPSFDEFVRPTMRWADIIIPRGADNVIAVDLMTKHIARQLDERGFTLRSRLAQFSRLVAQDLGERRLPPHVILLDAKPQLKFIMTQLRDQQTPRDEFVFFADRLARLVVERALAELNFTEKIITTPTGSIYHGLQRSTKDVCGVSIVRAGVPMERGLRKVCEGVTIGKLLIQTDPRTSEPQLHYCKLPDDVAGRHVLLMDATIATGAAAIMAVRVLMDHDVQEDKIIFVSFIASPQGLAALTTAFPRMKIVVSEVEWAGLDEHYWLQPGVGNFGDRYFGTV